MSLSVLFLFIKTKATLAISDWYHLFFIGLFLGYVPSVFSQTLCRNPWEEAFDNKTSNIIPVNDHYALFLVDNLYGLITIDKDTIIKPEFDWITLGSNLEWAITLKGMKFGLCDIHGNEILPVVYTGIREEGRHIIVSNMDTTLILDPGFRFLDPDAFIKDGINGVKCEANDGWSNTIILQNGDSLHARLLETSHDKLQDFLRDYSKLYYVAETKEGDFLLDACRRVIAKGSGIYSINPHIENLYEHRLPAEVCYVIESSDGIAKLYVNGVMVLKGDYSYYGLLGNYYIGIKKGSVDVFNKDHRIVKTWEGSLKYIENDNMYLALNDSMVLAVDPYLNSTSLKGRGEFKKAGPVYFELLSDPDGPVYNLYDCKGHCLLNGVQNVSWPVRQNNGIYIYLFEKSGLKGWLYDGEIIFPNYDEAIPLTNGTILASKSGKWGVVDPDNNVVLQFDWDAAEYIENSSVFALRKDNVWTVHVHDRKFIASNLVNGGRLINFLERGTWKTVSHTAKVYPLKLDCLSRDQVMCNSQGCRLFLHDSDFTSYLSFDTIFVRGSDYVGQKGDSLYYINNRSDIIFTVAGKIPLRQFFTFNEVLHGDSSVLVDRIGINPFGRAFKAVNPTLVESVPFYTMENGKCRFYTYDKEAFNIDADSVKLVIRSVYAIHFKGSAKWIDLENFEAFEPSPFHDLKVTYQSNYVGRDSAGHQVLLNRRFECLSGAYDLIQPMFGKCLYVASGEKTGLLDTEGKVVVPLDRYDGPFQYFDSYRLVAKKGGKTVFFNLPE